VVKVGYRINWVDYAKGIGIVLVVYGHVLRGLNTSGMSVNAQFFEASDKILYSFHMPLFFLLSGLFVEKWLIKGMTRGIKEKVVTLLFPYFLWTIMQGSINVVLSKVTNNSISWGEVFTKVWYQPLWQFWYLYVLFLSFLVCYVLRKLMPLNIVLIVSALFYFAVPYVDFWVSKSFMGNFFFFILGAYLMNLNLDKIEKKVYKTKYFILSIASFLALSSLYLLNLTLLNSSIFNLILGLAGINLVITLSVFISKQKYFGFIKYLGTTSLAIYLIHILAASGVRIILSKFLGIYNVSIHLIVGTILGVILPIIAFEFSKKLKISDIFFGGKLNSNATNKLLEKAS
jgi:fucose 4-O-acetylase-like acetyltransferase